MKKMSKMFLSCLAMTAALAASPVAADEDPVLIPIQRLSLEMAMNAAQGAIEQCRKEGVQIAVTVIDRGGHPQVILRDVLAMDLALTISQQKAYTALSFNTPTSQLDNRFKGAYGVPKLEGLVISAGGLPITAGGTIVGGIGVSGAPSGETDEKCAKAGVEAITADLEMSGF